MADLRNGSTVGGKSIENAIDSQAKADKALNDAKAHTNAHIGTGGTAHAVVTTTVNGFMSSTDKTKLDGISANAKKVESSTTNGNIKIDSVETTVYTHPANHPASIITQDASNRFVTDTEKSTWNAKASTATATTTANGLMSSTDKTKLDGVATGATKVEDSTTNGNIKINGAESVVYTHPANHPASIITQDASNRFVTDAEKATWNDKYTKSEVDTKINTVTTSLDWKESVGTFADLATTYSSPEDGWTVNVKDTDVTYRYTGTEWIAISANAIPNATTSVDGKMSATDKAKLDGIQASAINQTTADGRYAQRANNLSDLTSISTARTNLGLTGNTNTTHYHDSRYYQKTEVDTALAGKASTDVSTTTTNGLMSSTDKTKLDGIAANANNYVHPATHAPSIIVQDASNRFVTDTEKSTWNAKASTATATTTTNGLMSSTDKTKLDGVAANAEVNQNAYTTVVAGGASLVADTKTDTLTINAGSGIIVSGNSTTDTITISTSSTMETDSGAQAKADTALASAKAYTDAELNTDEVMAGTLTNGVNTIDSVEKAHMNIVATTGRTLVNLLGSAGNFEFDGDGDGIADGWLRPNQSTTGSLVTTDVSNGKKAQQVNFINSTVGRYITRSVLFEPNKHYIILTDGKTVTGSTGKLVVYYNGVASYVASSFFTTTKSTYYVTISPTSAGGEVRFASNDNTNESIIVDATRVYEITLDEKNALSGMTLEQIKEKYPYTDNVTGIVNPTIQVKRPALTTSDFGGKTSGDVILNPHIAKTVYNSALQGPSSTVTSEMTQAFYDLIKTVNGSTTTNSITATGLMAQVLFSFNIVEHVERKYGMKIPSANKANWVKANASKISFNFTGRGSSPAGNIVNLRRWGVPGGNWYGAASINSSTISSAYIGFDENFGETALITDAIDDNGFVHFLAYANAANGTTASVVYVDYVSFDVTLKSSSPILVKSQEIINTTLHSLPIVLTGNKLSDELIIEDNKLKKIENWREVILDGSLNWIYNSDATGSKIVRVPNFGFRVNEGIVVKYDGKILAKVDAAANFANPDSYRANTTDLFISIDDSISGWGESYTPTNDEVKAFFWGWKMVTVGEVISTSKYNGTGTKGWVEIPKVMTVPNDTVSLTFMPWSSGWEWDTATGKGNVASPYKMIFQLPIPNKQEVETFNKVVLLEGSNTIELKQGIVRERANVVLSPEYGYYINNTALPASLLKNRLGNFIKLYKNDVEEQRIILDTVNAFGKYCIYLQAYDPNAAYYVEYELSPEDTVKAEPITFNYAQNIKSVLNENTELLTILNEKIDSLPQKFVNQQRVTDLQLYINNRWVRDGARGFGLYIEEDTGWATIYGGMANGSNAAWTVLANLPQGVRPLTYVQEVVGGVAGGNNTAVVIRIDPDGTIKLTGTVPASLTEMYFNCRFRYRPNNN